MRKGRTRVDKARATVALAIVINIVIDNSMWGKLRLSIGDNLVINKLLNECSQAARASQQTTNTITQHISRVFTKA